MRAHRSWIPDTPRWILRCVWGHGRPALLYSDDLMSIRDNIGGNQRWNKGTQGQMDDEEHRHGLTVFHCKRSDGDLNHPWVIGTPWMLSPPRCRLPRWDPHRRCAVSGDPRRVCMGWGLRALWRWELLGEKGDTTSLTDQDGSMRV
jgi:hypothetical protein